MRLCRLSQKGDTLLNRVAVLNHSSYITSILYHAEHNNILSFRSCLICGPVSPFGKRQEKEIY